MAGAGATGEAALSDEDDGPEPEAAVEERGGAAAVREAMADRRVVDLSARRGFIKGEGDPEGYDPADLNEFYAVVMVGSRTVIMEENFKRFVDGERAAPIEDHVRLMTYQDFAMWFANDLVFFENKDVSVAALWLRDVRRRQYRGVVFEPGGAPVGYYNLWRGFTVEPDPAASCAKFLDHVRVNVAQENEAHFRYIMAWAADLVRRPTARTGISLVLRGDQGSGKTMFGKVLGRLMAHHYVLVDHPRYIVGNFNAHMASTLLLQADEGFWAGDKEAEGRLKSLITSDVQMIEYKGKDALRTRNYVHLLVTSNNRWVVPAGHQERRFAIFDVGNQCQQNRAYFGEIFAELEDGGYGALMHYLLTEDFSDVDLADIPRTHALYEQKIASLPAEESWWFECLRRGWIRQDKDNGWANRVPVDAVYASYAAYCDKLGVRHKKTPEQVGQALRDLAPGVVRGRFTASAKRVYMYQLPGLDACREAFARMIWSDVPWEEVVWGGAPDPEPGEDGEEMP